MKRILLVLLGLGALSVAAWADPPARVGRLSYLQGSVSFSPGAGGPWQPALLNYPVTAGNMLSTNAGSYAEIEIGPAAVRLGPDTSIAFEALDDQTVQVRLDNGTVSVRLRVLGRDQSFLVDAQPATVSLFQPGLYRVEQLQTGEVAVTTRDGEAQVTGGAAAFRVYSGQSADIPASDPGAYRITAAPPEDSMDRWVASRDAQQDDVASTQYVSSEMDGAEDLDAYGTWRVVADYGPVWIPDSVPVGWAPYTLGRWVWIEPWGWTWVDNEPWGFAPFHYGRWVLYTGVWCWVPGPIVSQPVFAPALVRWVGGMPTRYHPPVMGSIHWAPLGPRQVFRPAYPVSTTYFRALNGTVVYRPRVVYPHSFYRPEGPVAGPVVRPAPVPESRPGYVVRGPMGPRAPFIAPRPAYPTGRGPAYRRPVYRGPVYHGPVYRGPAYARGRRQPVDGPDKSGTVIWPPWRRR